jgi:hypothetical protein
MIYHPGGRLQIFGQTRAIFYQHWQITQQIAELCCSEACSSSSVFVCLSGFVSRPIIIKEEKEREELLEGVFAYLQPQIEPGMRGREIVRASERGARRDSIWNKKRTQMIHKLNSIQL